MKRTVPSIIVSVLVTNYPRRPAKVFDYVHDKVLQSGQWVVVPFGKTQTTGIVIATQTSSDIALEKLKPVSRVLDLPQPPKHYLKLAEWLGEYYAAHPRAIWHTILPSGLQAKPRKGLLQDSVAQAPAHLPPLSIEQEQVIKAIQKLPSQKAVLIQGITGSGKTRIYEDLIQSTLERGQSVLILAPEIVLSTHLQRRLEESLGASLLVTHSGLTATQRRAVWLKALSNTTPQVYLGARSALFLPIHNLGLIIIDEEHDTSYKQDQSPRYHAVTVAGRLAQLTGARLVLGSATPSLTTLELVHRGRIARLSLPTRHGGAKLPEIMLVEHHNKHGVLSDQLHHAIEQTLEHQQQALILHNKRGTARRLSCDSCGQAVRCDHCDTTMILHADLGRLKCHLCNRELWPPSRCPSCNQDDLRYSGIGTKQLETTLQQLFPNAHIERLDRDSIDRDSLPSLLERMQRREINILIGTQMIAKGLDFPHVSLVAIIDTDSLLHGTDFSASERAASLIIQASGRAGRGNIPGRVILQTHSPQQPILQAIQAHDWNGFATQELIHRHTFHYPPYRWLLRLWVRRSNARNAERAASEFSDLLAQKYPNIEVLGPATPLHHKDGIYHTRQLIVRSTQRKTLTDIADSPPSGWQADLDPIIII